MDGVDAAASLAPPLAAAAGALAVLVAALRKPERGRVRVWRRVGAEADGALRDLPLADPHPGLSLQPCLRCKGSGVQACGLCYGAGSTALPGYVNTLDSAHRRLCRRCAGSGAHACGACGGVVDPVVEREEVAGAAGARREQEVRRQARPPALPPPGDMDDF